MEKQPIVVLFASALPEEGTQFKNLLALQGQTMVVHVPSNLTEVENLLKDSGVDVIVTDLEFQNGAFADWLFLWPFPFVLLADYANRERIDAIIQDNACSFLIREKEGKHLEVLPILIRKVFQDHQLRKKQNQEVLLREQKYLDLVQALPDVVYSLDAEGYFTFVNDAVREFGYEPIELIGKHFSVLLDPNEVPRVSRKLVLEQYQGKITGPEKAPKLFDERRRGSRKTVGLEVRLRCKSIEKTEGCTEGQRLGLVTSYGEVDAAGFFENDSKEGIKLKGSVGIIHDITKRKQTQEQLVVALQEKNLLLKEIHHRVKNNLQIISSLLHMQMRNLKDPADANLFLDIQMQIRSMALIHEHLYLSEQLSTVNVASYLNKLVQSLEEVYGNSFNNIQIHLNVEEFSLNIHTATPLGLLVNELVSNSIKYAFPDSQGGNIWIRLERAEGKSVLTVADDGIGLPEDFHLHTAETLGYQLIHALVEQLEGKLERLPQKGTAYRIELPF